VITCHTGDYPLETTLSIPGLNFTLQDMLGAAVAFGIFPIMIVFPGYVSGWVLDLFDFRKRQPIVRLGIGLILSFAITPIILDLTAQLVSIKFSILTIAGFAVAFAFISLREKTIIKSQAKLQIKTIFLAGSVWVAFVILSLINIQWKDQLYLSAVTDQITRVSVINAITRTGAPPVNPSYYPGHPVELTFLFYFWYILCSLVDLIGGKIVDARAALNASSAWSGIGLMAIAALYLRLRNPGNSATAWRSAKIGIGLLFVGGLDALPFILLVAKIGNIVGGNEHLNALQFAVLTWNNLEIRILTLLGTWMGASLWVPQHIAAVIAGFSALLLAHSARSKKPSKQFAILAVAGLAFASAVGLSTWVTLVFAIFWGIWVIALLIQKTERSLSLSMICSGIIAVLLASPFLMGIIKGGDGGAGQLPPVVLGINTVSLLKPIIREWPSILRSLAALIVLPIGYMWELGFFFVAGIYWLKSRDRKAFGSNPFYLQEILLLVVVLFVVSFASSTFETRKTGDLGWRGWLPGQFVLLVWSVDVLERFLFNKGRAAPTSQKPSGAVYTGHFLRALITIGILTILINAVFFRIYMPVLLGPEAGRRTYSARLAYDYLRDHISANVITQYNPTNFYDGPSGLYGTHQMVISDITAYRVPLDGFHKLVDEIGVLFTNENMANWQLIDRICQEHSIDVLITKDSDPLWSSLATLKAQRPALYENTHYALFACGNYAQNEH
jgi:hypothetical protein